MLCAGMWQCLRNTWYATPCKGFLPEDLSLHTAENLRLTPGWHLQVKVPNGVDDKDASQFLVNPVTGNGIPRTAMQIVDGCGPTKKTRTAD